MPYSFFKWRGTPIAVSFAFDLLDGWEKGQGHSPLRRVSPLGAVDRV